MVEPTDENRRVAVSWSGAAADGRAYGSTAAACKVGVRGKEAPPKVSVSKAKGGRGCPFPQTGVSEELLLQLMGVRTSPGAAVTAVGVTPSGRPRRGKERRPPRGLQVLVRVREVVEVGEGRAQRLVRTGKSERNCS